MNFANNGRKIYTYDLIGRSQIHYLFSDEHKAISSDSNAMANVTEQTIDMDNSANDASPELLEPGKKISNPQEGVRTYDSPDVSRGSARSEMFKVVGLEGTQAESMTPAPGDDMDHGQKMSASEPSQTITEEGSPFMWASPIQNGQFSSPALHYDGEKLVTGPPYSRELFLKTGRFDPDIDELLNESENAADHTDDNPDDRETSVNEVQINNSQPSVRLLPEGTAQLKDSPPVHVPDESLDQSNFSHGRLSESVDDYLMEDSNLSDQNSPISGSMDQSIRSAIAGLGPAKSSSSEHKETRETPPEDQPGSVESEDDKIPCGISSQAGSIPFLDDSFSSEVTEPEEKFVADPPLALLMYSQPKVWTDEAGEPTKEDEDAVSINTEGDDNQEAMEDMEQHQASSAGLWMEDDMLQTIVPQQKLSVESKTLDEDSVGGSVVNPQSSSPPSLPDGQELGPSISMNDMNGERDSDSVSFRDLDHSKESERDVTLGHSDSSRRSSKSENLSQTSLNYSSSDQGGKDRHRLKSKIPQTVRSPSVTKKSESRSKSSETKDDTNKSLSIKQEHKKSNPNLSKSHKSGLTKSSTHRNQPQKGGNRTSKKSHDSRSNVSTSSGQSLDESFAGMVGVKPGLVMENVSKPDKKELTLTYNEMENSVENTTLKSGIQQVPDPPIVRSEHGNNDKHKSSKKTRNVQQVHDQRNSKPQPRQEETGNGHQNQNQNITVDRQRIAHESTHPPTRPQNVPQERNMSSFPHSRDQVEAHTQMFYEHSGFVPQTQNQIAAQQAKLAQLRQTRMALLEQEQLLKEENQGNQNKIFISQEGILSRETQQSQCFESRPPGQPDVSKARSPNQTVEELLAGVGVDVYSMEQVRNHLQDVLKETSQIMPEKSFDNGAHMQSLLSSFQDDKDTSLASASTYPGLSHKALAELTSQMENLSSYGSVSEAVMPRSDATVGLENHLLRENVEKEIYRRKHCEKQIQLLQSKLLEVQQQLAVAVNTDRKKDSMIEQLDKALAKVVEGWRNREAEKVEIINRLQAENTKLGTRSDAQQQLLQKFEVETATVVDQLTAAQKTVEMAEQDRDMKIAVMERERLEAIEHMETEREKYNAVNTEHIQLLHQAEKVSNQLSKIQATLEHERDTWEEKEREYLQKIDEITENHLTSMEQEKSKSDQQTQLLRDTHELLSSTQMEVQELRQQLDTTAREKDSLHVQLGLLEDKMESSLRKMEADLRCEAEKELSSKLDEAHRRQRASEEDLHERLRRQVQELSERHTMELKELHRQHQDDLRRKDETLTHKVMEFEETIQEGRAELESLQTYVKQLEAQRQEMTSRLQMMMQSHWEEALNLLSGAPPSGNKAALMSHLSGLRMKMVPEDAAHYPGSLPDEKQVSSLPTPNLRPGAVPDEKQFTSLPATNHSMTHPAETHSDRCADHGFKETTPNLPGYSDKAFSALRPEEISPYEEPPSANTTVLHRSPYPSLDTHLSDDQHQETSYLRKRLFQHQPGTGEIQAEVPRPPTGQHPGDQPPNQPRGQLDQSASSNQSHHHGYQQPGNSGRQFVSGLKPSFLETLTKEAEQFVGFHMSQNSSMLSDEGCAPLPHDTSVSTINDDMDMQNMTGMSMGPLTDMSHYTESHRYSTARLSDIPEIQHQGKQRELDYSVMSERSQPPEDRRKELERYMKMLLNRSPGQPIPPNEDHSAEQDLDGSYLSPSRNQPAPLEIGGVGQHPPGVAFTKTTVVTHSGYNPGATCETGGEHFGEEHPQGALSESQYEEITRLLGVYRNRAAADPTSHQHQAAEFQTFHQDNSMSSGRRPVQPAASQPQTANTKPGQTWHERPTRLPPVLQGETQVIKVPTGVDGNSPKRSPSPGKAPPVNRNTQRQGTTRNNPPPNKGERKADNKQQKPKAKVWK